MFLLCHICVSYHNLTCKYTKIFIIKPQFIRLFILQVLKLTQFNLVFGRSDRSVHHLTISKAKREISVVIYMSFRNADATGDVGIPTAVSVECNQKKSFGENNRHVQAFI